MTFEVTTTGDVKHSKCPLCRRKRMVTRIASSNSTVREMTSSHGDCIGGDMCSCENVMASVAVATQLLKFLDSLRETSLCTTNYISVYTHTFYMECWNCGKRLTRCCIRMRIDGEPCWHQVGWFCRGCRKFFKA